MDFLFTIRITTNLIILLQFVFFDAMWGLLVSTLSVGSFFICTLAVTLLINHLPNVIQIICVPKNNNICNNNAQGKYNYLFSKKGKYNYLKKNR